MSMVEANDRYTIKSQLPPAVAATIIAVQYAVDYKTFMVFLYMYAPLSLQAFEFEG
jgi:hypothetical protein